MRVFWSLTLRRQLAIAMGLLLVPLLIAAIWSGFSSIRERATELGDQTRVIALTAATYISGDLTNLDDAAEGLESNDEVQAMNPQRSEELFRRLMLGHPMLSRIDLVSRSRDIFARATSSSADFG